MNGVNIYGPETCRRLAAAKQQFDPNNILTPGPGIFSVHNDA
jgi:FAD/FMN-containing dehydrogenase